MQIISHRGYWKIPSEKNTEVAFIRAFTLGFGVETDIRDLNGQLVISHDPPEGNPLTLENFLHLYTLYEQSLPLALNIKADGLQNKIKQSLKDFNIKSYFLFDMSLPDMVGYIKQKMSIFTRVSDYEKIPFFYEDADGIWLDCFENDWMSKVDIEVYLQKEKKVCIVSPELHGRCHQQFWSNLLNWNLIKYENLMLCTDFPEEGRNYFL